MIILHVVVDSLAIVYDIVITAMSPKGDKV